MLSEITVGMCVIEIDTNLSETELESNKIKNI